MKEKMMKLSGPKKLAIIAFSLGLIAMFAGDPYDNVYTKINSKELAISTLNNADKVQVKDLADWIITQRADFRLIDLRSEDEFGKYFIPSAYNISPVKILNSGLMKNEKIILYTDDNSGSAQAWYMLKTKGFQSVYILDGGLNAWKDQIIFPKLAKDPTNEQLTEFNKMKEVSIHFGGVPQSETNETVKEFKMPELKAPVQTTLTTGKKKKKREGC
jgi:rhodanese-related sulfurtransferase